MGLYEGIKDAAKIVQRADNIELYRKLLDLGDEALSLQEKIASLQKENEELKKQIDLTEDIEYYTEPYLTRKSDIKPIKYCAACWADKNKLLPLQFDEMYVGRYICPLCKTRIYTNRTW